MPKLSELYIYEIGEQIKVEIATKQNYTIGELLKRIPLKMLKDEIERRRKEPKRFKCMLCGRDKFTRKTPHKCGSNYRKHHIIWQDISDNQILEY